MSGDGLALPTPSNDSLLRVNGASGPSPRTRRVLLFLQLYHFALYGVDEARYPPPYCLQGVLHHHAFSTMWEHEEAAGSEAANKKRGTLTDLDMRQGQGTSATTPGLQWRCNARWRRSETLVTATSAIDVPAHLAAVSPPPAPKMPVPGEVRDGAKSPDPRSEGEWSRSEGKRRRTRSRSRSSLQDRDHEAVRDVLAFSEGDSSADGSSVRGLQGTGLTIEVYSYGSGVIPTSTRIGRCQVRLDTLLRCPHGSRVRLTISRATPKRHPLDGDYFNTAILDSSPEDDAALAKETIGELFCSFRAALRVPLGFSVRHVHVSPNPLAVLRLVREDARRPAAFPPSTIALDMDVTDPHLFWEECASVREGDCAPSEEEVKAKGKQDAVSSHQSPTVTDTITRRASSIRAEEDTTSSPTTPLPAPPPRLLPITVSPSGARDVEEMSQSNALPRAYPAVLSSRRTLWNYEALHEWSLPFSVARAERGFPAGVVLATGHLYQLPVLHAPAECSAASSPYPLCHLGSFTLRWPPAQYEPAPVPDVSSRDGKGQPTEHGEVVVRAIFTSPLTLSAHCEAAPSAHAREGTPIEVTALVQLRAGYTSSCERENIMAMLEAAVRGRQAEEKAAALSTVSSTSSITGSDGSSITPSATCDYSISPLNGDAAVPTPGVGGANEKEHKAGTPASDEARGGTNMSPPPRGRGDAASPYQWELKERHGMQLSVSPSTARSSPLPLSSLQWSFRVRDGGSPSRSPFRKAGSVFHLTALEREQVERIDVLFRGHLSEVRQAKEAIVLELGELDLSASSLSCFQEAERERAEVLAAIQKLEAEIVEEQAELEALQGEEAEREERLDALEKELLWGKQRGAELNRDGMHLHRHIEGMQQEMREYMKMQLDRYVERLHKPSRQSSSKP